MPSLLQKMVQEEKLGDKRKECLFASPVCAVITTAHEHSTEVHISHPAATISWPFLFSKELGESQRDIGMGKMQVRKWNFFPTISEEGERVEPIIYLLQKTCNNNNI